MNWLMIRLIGREFQSTLEILKSKMRLEEDIWPGGLIGHHLILIIHIETLEVNLEYLIHNDLMNMVVGLSIATRCIRPFVCAATFLEIAMRAKLGMMHSWLIDGMVGTRNAD
jgi:hypothetical protein